MKNILVFLGLVLLAFAGCGDEASGPGDSGQGDGVDAGGDDASTGGDDAGMGGDDAGTGGDDAGTSGDDGGDEQAGDGDPGTDRAADGDGGGDDGGGGGDDGGGGDTGGDSGGGLQGCVTGTFTPYFGNLHSHSNQSDGDGTPEEAFTHARDQAHLDIMILTDHMEQLYIPADEWENCHQTADSFYVPGSYLTDCGFEYATALVGLTGHNNVFFSPDLFTLAVPFEAFYTELAACAECIASFNHPGDSAGHTWHDFEYHAEADVKLNLIEFNTDADPWDFFFRALDAGWHVSPIYNQDNHGTDWGTKNDRRAGFFMTDLTREALYDAMINRRAFMTFDKNATVVMMAEEVCWMGSILTGAASLTFTATAEDADAAEGFTTIEFFGPGTTSLGSHDCAGSNPCTFEITLPISGSTYVTARATQTDGDYLVSAPIWASP